MIKAETEKKEDLIAVTGLYIDEETHCTHQPLLAKQGDFVTVLKEKVTQNLALFFFLVLIILNDEIKLLFLRVVIFMCCPLAI